MMARTLLTIFLYYYRTKQRFPSPHRVERSMKKLLTIVKWTAIVAGVIAIPILVKQKMDEAERDRENIRYDTNDYISESGL